MKDLKLNHDLCDVFNRLKKRIYKDAKQYGISSEVLEQYITILEDLAQIINRL